MSKGRLTRQELGWLLTQEAQGAAARLREGVAVMRSVPPAAVVPAVAGDEDIGASLDALDDMMQMLSTLHTKSLPGAHSRRGRMDLAALLWEIAPEARVQIEPGAGTEVFGDEAELRRMLHILVGHGGGMGSSITVRRDGEDIRMGVVLGPDTSPTMETERAWLSRMATRYGGRHELEGGMEVLVLPANDDHEERTALRKELDEARAQGEAYARELAAVLDRGDESTALSSIPPPPMTQEAERLGVLTRLSRMIALETKSLVNPALRDMPLSTDEHTEGLRKRLQRLQELAHELGSFGELEADEANARVSLRELAATAVQGLAARSEGLSVEMRLSFDEDLVVRAMPRASAVLLREVLLYALHSSPKGSTVTVRGDRKGDELRLHVDDCGPAMPSAARKTLVTGTQDPGAFGRPTSAPLLMAAEIALRQGFGFELSDAPDGGLRVSLCCPPPT
jgi:two-component system, OmpR family, sensor kinase